MGRGARPAERARERSRPDDAHLTARPPGRDGWSTASDDPGMPGRTPPWRCPPAARANLLASPAFTALWKKASGGWAWGARPGAPPRRGRGWGAGPASAG